MRPFLAANGRPMHKVAVPETVSTLRRLVATSSRTGPYFGARFRLECPGRLFAVRCGDLAICSTQGHSGRLRGHWISAIEPILPVASVRYPCVTVLKKRIMRLGTASFAGSAAAYDSNRPMGRLLPSNREADYETSIGGIGVSGYPWLRVNGVFRGARRGCI